MSNELIVISAAILDLAIIVLAFRLGRPFLIAAIITNLIMVSLAAPKVGSFFGFVGSPQSIFYASIFLGTDLLAEFYGRRSGYQVIFAGFLALVMVALLGQVVIFFTPIAAAAGYGAAFGTVFGATWRIALASFLAYLISQNFDIWFFHRIREITRGRKLWLRNLFSTSTSQLIDTAIFFPIAFAGVMPELLQVMIVAYLVKLLVAVLDTPFIYLAHRISPVPPAPLEEPAGVAPRRHAEAAL